MAELLVSASKYKALISSVAATALLGACASDDYYADGYYYDSYADGYGYDYGDTGYDRVRDRAVRRYNDDDFGPRDTATVGYGGIENARRAHALYSDYEAERRDGECERTVRVRRGDTVSGIAELCDVPARAIMAANPGLYSPHQLSVGQRLNIPAVRGEVYEGAPGLRYGNAYDRGYAPDYGHDSVQYYRVRRGDTLAEISDRFNVSLRTIARLNPGVNPYSLDVGERLALPAHAEPDYYDRRGPDYRYRAADVTYEPAIEISPLRGAPGTLIKVNASDLPPDTDVALYVGHTRDDLQEYHRFRTDSDGYARARFRLGDGYTYDSALVAVKTIDGRYQSYSPAYTVLRNKTGYRPASTTVRRSVVGNDRYLERGIDPGDVLSDEIAIVGVLTGEGRRCPVLRDDAGNLFTLLGDLDGFSDGDRVLIQGSTQAANDICYQGETVQVLNVRPAAW
jgi:LysM repeat protein